MYVLYSEYFGGAGQPCYKAPPKYSESSTYTQYTEYPQYPSVPADLSVSQLFFAWLQPLRGRVDETTEALLFQAFKAGYETGQGARQIAPLEGTAESRTIVAALILFIDQVLQHQPDEVTSGEFLSATDTQKVIEKYRKGEIR